MSAWWAFVLLVLFVLGLLAAALAIGVGMAWMLDEDRPRGRVSRRSPAGGRRRN